MTALRGRRKLTQREVEVLLSLLIQGAVALPSRLRSDQRPLVLPLWRMSLVELWFRRPPADRAPLEGPFYRLTPHGAELARAIYDKRQPPKE